MMDKINDNTVTELPIYRLLYFPVGGLGEPIRLIFSYADVPFEDKRITHAEWDTIKACIILTQSVAIRRFLGKKFNLVTNDPIKEALLEAFVDNMKDVFMKVGDALKLKTVEAEKEFDDSLQQLLSTYEELVIDGHIYGTNSTNWNEIYFTGFIEQINKITRSENLNKFPRLSSVIQGLYKKEGVQRWMQRRPADAYDLPPLIN